jgi:hypothetical protein
MQFSATFLPLLALALPTSAIISGLTAPATITAGEPFILTLTTQDYIQSVYDVSAAFGIATGRGYPDSLGNVFASAYLGPPLSNILTPIQFTVIVDGSTPQGDALITASVTSLYGVDAEPSINFFNTTVTVA